jgi:hypothetical protein
MQSWAMDCTHEEFLPVDTAVIRRICVQLILELLEAFVMEVCKHRVSSAELQNLILRWGARNLHRLTIFLRDSERFDPLSYVTQHLHLLLEDSFAAVATHHLREELNVGVVTVAFACVENIVGHFCDAVLMNLLPHQLLVKELNELQRRLVLRGAVTVIHLLSFEHLVHEVLDVTLDHASVPNACAFRHAERGNYFLAEAQTDEIWVVVWRK